MTSSEQFAGTTDVRQQHRFDEAALRHWFAAQVDPGANAGFRISQFKGGQSNPTFLLETPNRRYVLRRKPPGVLLRQRRGQ